MANIIIPPQPNPRDFGLVDEHGNWKRNVAAENLFNAALVSWERAVSTITVLATNS